MTFNIPTPQRANNKLQGEFYPLQKQELMALRKAKLINNTAFVHLALRYENPFCDRRVQILPKEFSLAWNIPESSVYEAIGKLKKLGVVLIKRGKVMIEWVQDKIGIPVMDSSQENNSEPDKTLWDSRINSEIPEKILSSQNFLRDPRKNSEFPENSGVKALSEANFSSPQTIQTPQTSSYVSDCETHTKENVLQIKDPWIEEKKEEDSQGIINELNLAEEKITDEIANSINQKEEEFWRECSINETNKIQSDVNILTPSVVSEENILTPSVVSEENILTPSVVSALTTLVRQGKSDRTLSKTQSVNWQWLPEGVWNINGKLDPAFQEWLAKRWMAKYDDIADIYEAKSNVLSYFYNHPAKLPIKWEEYRSLYLSKGENIKLRIEHECKIKDKEKQEFCDRVSALKPVDDSQFVSTNKPIPNNLLLSQSQSSVNVDSNKQDIDIDVKVVKDENDVKDVNNDNTPITSNEDKPIATQQEDVDKYVEIKDDEGKVIKRYKDYTGFHQKQIPVNQKVVDMMANFLEGFKRKGGKNRLNCKKFRN